MVLLTPNDLQTQLSEQLFLDCTFEELGRDGCEGGLKQYVWDWVIKTQHVTRLASYPYKGTVSSHLVFISSCLVDWVATYTL